MGGDLGGVWHQWVFYQFIYMNGVVSHLRVSWVLYKIEAMSTLVWESHEERKSS